MGKKDGPSAPPPPDPVATAQAQSKINTDAAITQANLNRIDQYTPQGNLTYTQKTNPDGTPATNADGTPQYQQTMTYSPDEQKKYDLNNQVATNLDQLAVDNIGRVQQAQSTPFNFDGMTPLQTQLDNTYRMHGIGQPKDQVQSGLDYSKLTALPGTNDFSADQQRMADTVYQQAASRLNPQWQQSDSDLKSQLAAQGISEDSDAYRRAMDNQARAKNDAYNQATYSAQQAGSDEQSRLFGLALSARQQGQNEVNSQGQFANDAQAQEFQQKAARAAVDNANAIAAFNQNAATATFNNQARQQQIQEASYLRNMPINDIAALLGTGAGVQDPTFNPVAQVGVAAPDYMGAVNSNYAQKMNQYNQQQAGRSQMLGSIFGAAGTAAMAFSDRRFKENIVRIGTLANGLPTYAFNYVWNKAQQFGVMAQDVLKVIPEAVGEIDGVLYVDYGKVY